MRTNPEISFFSEQSHISTQQKCFVKIQHNFGCLWEVLL